MSAQQGYWTCNAAALACLAAGSLTPGLPGLWIMLSAHVYCAAGLVIASRGPKGGEA